MNDSIEKARSESVEEHRRPPPSAVAYWLAIAFIFGCGAGLRVAAMRGDLWLDELWSLEFARQLRSPIEVFTRIHLDNNHPINTLWMYALGDFRSEAAYRLLSLAAGLGTLWVVFAVAREWGRLEALLALLFFAVSYPQVHYSSEARGYAPMVFFATLCFHLMNRSLRKPNVALTAGFALSAILGFLSHLAFLNFYLACTVWSGWRTLSSARSPLKGHGQLVGWVSRPDVGSGEPTYSKISDKNADGGWKALSRLSGHFLRYHLVPIAALIVYALVDLLHTRVGGGPRYPMLDVVSSAAAWTAGLPDVGFFRWIALIWAVAIVLLEVVSLWRRDSDLWILFAGVIFIVPAFLLTLHPPELVYVRYFFINSAFLLLVQARILAKWLRAPGIGRWLAAAIILVMLAGHGRNLFRFFEQGRGQYRAALQAMAEQSSSPQFSVGSPGGLDVRLAVRFYASRLDSEKRPVYVSSDATEAARPDWFVLDIQDADFNPPARRRLDSGATYLLAGDYGYYGLSGWRWLVYKREP